MTNSFEKVAMSLGHLTLAFQELESQLLFLLSGFFSKEDFSLARIISGQLPFKRILDVLDSVFRARIRDKDFIERFQGIIRESSRLEQERNKHLHSYYHFRDIDRVSTQVTRIKDKTKRGRGHEFSTDEYDLAAVDKISDDLYAVVDDIDAFLSDLHDMGLTSCFR